MNNTLAGSTVLPKGSRLRKELEAYSSDNKIIFMIGLPGVGKTLMVQQLAAIAIHQGRKVHLVQWDVARLAFETPEFQSRFPEIDGVTHAGIRLAAGEWLRRAIGRWWDEHTDPEHLLIGETALVGNRFVEIAQPVPDPIESVLREQATFLIPAPTLDVRAKIEAARAEEMRNPRHKRESASAPMNVLEMAMEEIRAAAVKIGLISDGDKGSGYDPDLYVSVYQKLLRHRRVKRLPIDQIFNVHGSAYDVGSIEGELVPTDEVVKKIAERYAALSDAELNARADNWWRIDDRIDSATMYA